jgi:hypothetical protein
VVAAPLAELLEKVTVWLCIAPFAAALNVTGFGLIMRPEELPPFTVRVAVTVNVLPFESVRSAWPGYWPEAKALAWLLICIRKEPPGLAMLVDARSQLPVLGNQRCNSRPLGSRHRLGKKTRYWW